MSPNKIHCLLDGIWGVIEGKNKNHKSPKPPRKINIKRVSSFDLIRN